VQNKQIFIQCKRFIAITYAILSLIAQPIIAANADAVAEIPTAITSSNTSNTQPADGLQEQPATNISESNNPPAQQNTDDDNAIQRIFHNRRQAAIEAHKKAQQRSMAARRKYWEAQIARLNARYQRLRQRAAADGVNFSETPPWNAANMDVSTTQKFRQDEQNSNATNIFPQPLTAPAVPPSPDSSQSVYKQPQSTDTPPDLERMQAIINGMTQEERDACTTVHRLSMGLMQYSRPYQHPPIYYNIPPHYGYVPRPGFSGYGYPRSTNGYNPYAGYRSYPYGSGYNSGIRHYQQPSPNWRNQW